MIAKIILAGLLITTPAVYGQTVTGQGIKAADTHISLTADSALDVKFNIVIPKETKISSNRMATLTPILRYEGQQSELPPIYIFGRKREILSERNDRMPADAYRIVSRNKRTEQTIEYQASVPYQAWMQHAGLYMQQDLCGCGNQQEETSEALLASVNLPDPAPVLPQIAFIAPQPEKFKRRTKEGSAFLDFPVNQTVIRPEYRKNPSELATINQTIESVKRADIVHINIHGYASPEGSYANNERLAKGRSEALKQYIIKKYHLDDSLFSVQSTPEDWAGFEKLAQGSDIEKKEQIMAIIRSSEKEDAKEAQLKALNAPYIYVLKEWFPALRHSDYEIKYKVEPFTAQQARAIVKQQPELLSLDEMFQAAQLCEKGSEEYYNLFETAVRFFPENPTANLNAAAMELERGNLQQARKYMEKTDMNTPAAKDNMQRIILLEGGNKK